MEVGDTIEVLKDNCNLYRKGAIGTVLELDVDNWLLVQFLSGEFSKVKKALGATAKGQWWVNPNEVKVVKESSMKEGYGLSLTREAMKESLEIMQKHEGDGYAVKAWAVEVDGEISPWCTYPSRKEAREERTWHADNGAKAHVRKVEIRKVKGKV